MSHPAARPAPPAPLPSPAPAWDAGLGPSGSALDDAATIDSLVRAMYESISGDRGAPRDWERNARLFSPGAQMVAMHRDVDGTLRVETFDVDGYRRSRAPFFDEAGFHEREIARRTEQYGSLAHVWSTYEARSTHDGATLFRGINAVQLAHRDGRWWILSIAWLREGPGDPLPERYLTGPS